MGRMVVKVGGSLLDCIPRLVEELRETSPPVLIVPGGGPFADLARDLEPPQEEGHWMAVAGMDQFGWYIASCGLPVQETLEWPSRPKVLLPYRILRSVDPLPHSWNVTSDTIAAWVAQSLGGDLLLLKSVDGIHHKGVCIEYLRSPLPCDEVDPFLLPYLFSHRLRCTILNGRIPGRLQAYLQGEPVPSTRIEPIL